MLGLHLSQNLRTPLPLEHLITTIILIIIIIMISILSTKGWSNNPAWSSFKAQPTRCCASPGWPGATTWFFWEAWFGLGSWLLGLTFEVPIWLSPPPLYGVGGGSTPFHSFWYQLSMIFPRQASITGCAYTPQGQTQLTKRELDWPSDI